MLNNLTRRITGYFSALSELFSSHNSPICVKQCDTVRNNAIQCDMVRRKHTHLRCFSVARLLISVHFRRFFTGKQYRVARTRLQIIIVQPANLYYRFSRCRFWLYTVTVLHWKDHFRYSLWLKKTYKQFARQLRYPELLVVYVYIGPPRWISHHPFDKERLQPHTSGSPN